MVSFCSVIRLGRGRPAAKLPLHLYVERVDLQVQLSSFLSLLTLWGYLDLDVIQARYW